MERQTYCVYNQTRECFLSLGVTAADTTFSRLKGLIGKLQLKSNEGLWVVPSSGVHTLGVLFPLDLIYLDENHRVVYATEHFPAFRIAPLRIRAASVLELPTHTIYSSQTQTGDQLVICVAAEMENRLRQKARMADRSADGEMRRDAPSALFLRQATGQKTDDGPPISSLSLVADGKPPEDLTQRL
jgi:uncharacterized membrane protein (UPF0127 family)